MTDQSATEQDSVAESFRERVTRHIDGFAPPSNFEAMCAAISRRIGPPKCKPCAGRGFVPLAGEQLQAFKDRMNNMHAECGKLTAQSLAPKLDEGDYERVVEDQDHRKRLAMNIQQIQRNMFDEKWAFKQRSKCTACGGSGQGKRAGDPEQLRPDALFTTIACPECRGSDSRQHDSLMQTHRGTSCGSFTLSTETDDHPEGTTCPKCHGAAFVVPITARPTLKTAEVLDDVDDFARRASRRRQRPQAPETPSDLIEQLQESEPLVAVATVVLLGPHGKEWAQHESGWGARFAIWPLVSGGQQIVQEATTASAVEDWYRRQIDLIRLERAASEASPDRVRVASLVSIADGQARKLEAKVEEALDRAEAAA